MRKLVSGLVLLNIGLLAGMLIRHAIAVRPAAVEAEESVWPAGSRVSGDICFEHATADSWEPAQLRRADGSLPVKGTSIAGEWFFPMDAGQLRLRACP